MRSVSVFFIIMFLLVSVTSVPQSDDDSDVKNAFQKYAADWNNENLEGVFSFIAEDFVQMPPNQPSFIGKKAIMADWKQYMAEYTSKWEPTITDLTVSGDLAYLRGPFFETRKSRSSGEVTTQKGNSVWVLRRNSQGEWKLILELWFGAGWEE